MPLSDTYGHFFVTAPCAMPDMPPLMPLLLTQRCYAAELSRHCRHFIDFIFISLFTMLMP